MEKFVPIKGLHHWAYRCRDAEETRHFYEDLLGLPLTHFIRVDDYVGTSGEHVDMFVHIFFEMADGSSLAFFDLGDDVAPQPSPNTPQWCNHMALQVGSVEDLDRAHKRLKDAGVEYLFTNPGSAETGIFAALAEDGDQRLVVSKHEGLVAAMADGYHRVSGKVGVIIAHVMGGSYQLAGQLFNAQVAGPRCW